VHFRDQLIAAPLKPDLSDLVLSGVPGYFRDQLIAAPLKQSTAIYFFVLYLNFRDQLIAAPLKRLRCRPWRATRRISAIN